MTNLAIIVSNMNLLIHEGIITADEEIHTFSHWKSLGYRVKKGEHAIAKFPIWKYTKGKRKEIEALGEEEAQARGYCFMKNSSWFSTRQVEPDTD